MISLRLRAALAASALLLAASSAPAVVPQIDWTADYNGPDSDWDSTSGGDIALHNGLLHVAGFSYVHYQREMVTIKYDTDGTQLWANIYQPYVGPNQPGEAHGVAVDSLGNVYVTGWTAQDSVTNYVDVSTLKYTPGGDLLWARRFRVAGKNAQPEAIALAPGGFLYITGAAWVGSGFDVMLLKYDLDGNLLWSRTQGESGSRWDAAFAIKLDRSGNVILGGYTEQSIVGDDRDFYVLKYDPNGQLLWEWRYASPANDDQVKDLAIDGAGDIYVTGRWYTHFTILELTPAGGLVWQDSFAGGGTAGEYPAGIELAPDGNLFAASTSWISCCNTSMVLFKYTPAGTRLWTRFDNGGYADAYVEDLTLDANGDPYMAGWAFNQNGHEDYLTARYGAGGDSVWTTAWSAPEDLSDYAYHIRVGDDLRVYVTGDSNHGLTSFYDIESVVYRQIDPTAVAARGSGREPRLVLPNPVAQGSLVALSPAARGPVSLFGIDGRRLLEVGSARSAAVGLSFRAPAPGVYFVRSGDRTERLLVVK